MNFDDLDDDQPQSFWKRNRIAILVGGVVIIALGFAATKLLKSGGTAPRKEPAVTMVSLGLPPPPLPPPPPPVQPPPQPVEQKMVEQPQVSEQEQKADKPEPQKPPDAPPANMGTGVTGNGPGDGFGLGGSGNGGMIGGGNGSGRGGGSKWGWYAGQVQSKIADAMRNNRRARTASGTLQVRVWPDSTGRITRASLAGTTGDPAVDAAIKNEVLTGLQLAEPPPAGMPLPITLRLSARRPQ